MDTTSLVVAGRRLPVPRVLKRTMQIAMALALSSLVLFAIMVANGMLAGKQPSFSAGLNAWLVFIQRPEIQLTAIITAVVSVLFVYWQRNQERRAGAAKT
ncbi:MAG: hypothetical protein NW223_02640 [Hyphomicrobiaceae bacterium]|nr:hypothetical protein [Hyphomicrobiaceae bacterium]